MADNNRNQSNQNRSYNQDWDDENSSQDRWNESDYGNQGNRDYNQNRDYGYSRSRYGQQSKEGNYGNRSNQYSRYNQGDYGNSDNDYNYRNSQHQDMNFGSDDRNYGYGGREYGSSYGGGNYQGNDSYYNSGFTGSSSRPSYGNSRNLYDREYEGFNRGQNSGYSGLGGANYGGGNEDRGRRSSEQGRSFGGYSGSNYGGNFYGGQRRDYGNNDTNERSWWDRTKDEVSSWFGDDDAERRRTMDRQQNYRGKGPRNYSRSDDRIKEDINDRLSDDPWVDASDIEVTVSSGEVTLTGYVNERSEKRRAEDLAEAVSGVKHVENRLRVGVRQEPSGSTGSTSGSASNIGTGASVGTSASVGSTLSPGSFGGETAVSQSNAGTTGSGTEKSGKSKSYV
ncbi:BON domain-containing protein [Chryseosolibacter indicus]|uniref:BON domain-containing protein n=1 Tax=Chryseosolibacter indicus TaxID=2782351 RepID=A0ABS5VRQ8_9BACT|nr:BON domain-containing protein [Chryseosolibacter indicus]MBT1704128.1 BON domain-containing protein [Chryseosolibacter indicus]